MASLRELRSRIRSVNSTKKITKAQELIATSRITKAQAKVEAAEPAATEIHTVMERLASASSLDHPMLRERENAKRHIKRSQKNLVILLNYIEIRTNS